MKIFQLIIAGLCFLISISEFLSRRSRVKKETIRLAKKRFSIEGKFFYLKNQKSKELKDLEYEEFDNKTVKIGNVIMFIIFTLASILLILK
jgi:hypothetical protein